jgi:hypothetical protein
MSRQKLLKTELSILEKSFPRNCDECFQIVIASPEELVCRFLDAKNNKRFTLLSNISVSVGPGLRDLRKSINVFSCSQTILW